MSEPVIKGPLQRIFDVPVEREKIDKENRTVELSFSSEAPVERYFGTEILDHEARSVDLTRLQDGAPLLRNHDPDQHIGVVENPRIDADRKGRATVRFSRNAAGEAAFNDVVDGILRKVSVGYVIHQTETKERQGGGMSTVRVTRWEPLEISLVSIPADNSVGVGRSQETTPTPPKKMPEQPDPNAGGGSPNTEQRGAPGKVTITREAIAAEQKEMRLIAKRLNTPEAFLNKALDEGWELERFRTEALRALPDNPPAAPRPNPEIGMNRKERENFSVLRAIRQIATSGRLDGLEKEASEAAAKHYGRDLAASVGNTRGTAFIIPEDVATHDFRHIVSGSEAQLYRNLLAGTATSGGFTVNSPLGPMIELLRNKTVLGQLGITIMSGLTGNVPLPVQTGGATGYWVSETGTITSSSATFGQKTLTPHRCGASIPMSLQFIAQTSLSAEAFARNELMTVLALLKDVAGLHGTGVSGQPLGVANTTGINQTVTYSNAATWADVVEHETGIAVDNADIGSMGFALSAATVGKWKTILKDSVAGAGYLITDNMTANGYPVKRTNQISGNISFFGVWSQLIHGMWAGQEVIVDPYGTNAKSGQVEVTIQELCDFLVRQPTAFNVSTDSAAQ